MSEKSIVKNGFGINKLEQKLPDLVYSTYRDWERQPELHISEKATDVETAAKRYLLYIMLPAWFAPGILDYIMHRRTKIEKTSGLGESLIHCLMMTEVGIPSVMTMLLKVNPLMLTLMSGATLAHEITAIWDVRAAVDGGREVTPTEQHIHSFLEVMPIMGLSITAILHWNQVQALFGRGKEKPDWSLRWKKPRLSKGYLLSILLSIFGFVVLPYGEEVIRCLRAKPSSN